MALIISKIAGILFCLLILSAFCYKIGLDQIFKNLNIRLPRVPKFPSLPGFQIKSLRLNGQHLKRFFPLLTFVAGVGVFVLLYFFNGLQLPKMLDTTISPPCSATVVGDDIDLLRVMKRPQNRFNDYKGSLPLRTKVNVIDGPFYNHSTGDSYYKIESKLHGFVAKRYLADAYIVESDHIRMMKVDTKDQPLGVRTQPNPNRKNFVGSIPMGASVPVSKETYIGTDGEEWVTVEYTLTGYVKAKYLRLE